MTPNQAAHHGITLNKDGKRRSAFELLAHPAVTLDVLQAVWPEIGAIEGVIADQLVIDARYASYVDRQSEDVAMLRRDEAVRIPQDFVYADLPGLSVELQHKLERHRPLTLAAAGQIDGITPSALMLVLAHVKKAQPRRVAG